MDEIAFLLEVEPELYSAHPNQYQVILTELGLYNKRDAKMIANFLKNPYFYNFLVNKINKN